MDSVCFAQRPGLRLDLPERLPSLSEYLCDDYLSPQLREDDEGNLIVQLEKNCPVPTTDHFSGFGSGFGLGRTQEQDSGTRTWTYLESKPLSLNALSTAAPQNITNSFETVQSNRFRLAPEVTNSYSFSTIDSLPNSWNQYPTQLNDFRFSSPSSSLSSSSSSSLTSLPTFSNTDVTSSSSNHNAASSRSVAAVTCSSASGAMTSSRKRTLAADSTASLLDDNEARKLELKRAKNREAAQRCQQRKQERIARLEGKVTRLREQNVALGHTVTGLRDQIGWLQRQIVAHANSGCQISLPAFAPFRQQGRMNPSDATLDLLS